MTYTPWKRYSVGIEMEMNTVNRQSRSISGTELHRSLSSLGLSHPVTGDGSRYGFTNGSVWEVKYDGSAGWEIATPGLTFDDDGENDDLRKACGALEALQPAIDTRCGLHVSIFCRDFTWKDLQRLHSMWVRHESFFFDMLPSSRCSTPSSGTWYCRPLRESGIYEPTTSHWPKAQAAVSATNEREFQQAIQNIGKYASLNMATWWAHGRVEFRLHSGTVNYEKIRNWTLLLCAFVERAIAHRTAGMPAVKVALPAPAPVQRRKGWDTDYMLKLVGLAGEGAHEKGAVLKEYCDERRNKFGLARRRAARTNGQIERLVAQQASANASFGSRF